MRYEVDRDGLPVSHVSLILRPNAFWLMGVFAPAMAALSAYRVLIQASYLDQLAIIWIRLALVFVGYWIAQALLSSSWSLRMEAQEVRAVGRIPVDRQTRATYVADQKRLLAFAYALALLVWLAHLPLVLGDPDIKVSPWQKSVSAGPGITGVMPMLYSQRLARGGTK